MAWQQEAVVERSNVVVEKKVGSCNNWSGKKSLGVVCGVVVILRVGSLKEDG